eukprot:1405091-Rhodomonas_salina.2
MSAHRNAPRMSNWNRVHPSCVATAMITRTMEKRVVGAKVSPYPGTHARIAAAGHCGRKAEPCISRTPRWAQASACTETLTEVPTRPRVGPRALEAQRQVPMAGDNLTAVKAGTFAVSTRVGYPGTRVSAPRTGEFLPGVPGNPTRALGSPSAVGCKTLTLSPRRRVTVSVSGQAECAPGPEVPITLGPRPSDFSRKFYDFHK